MNSKKMLQMYEKELKKLNIKMLLACSKTRQSEIAKEIRQHENVIELLREMSVNGIEVR